MIVSHDATGLGSFADFMAALGYKSDPNQTPVTVSQYAQAFPGVVVGVAALGLFVISMLMKAVRE